jgi:NADH dehydrogenase/NADH:ubiquinone oxidoreductase subunit G
MLKNMQETASKNGGYDSLAMQGRVESLSIVNQMTAELTDKQHLLSQAEIEEYQARIQNVSAIGEQLTQEGALLDAAKRVTEEKKKQLAHSARDKNADDPKSNVSRRQAKTEATKNLTELQKLYETYAKIETAQTAIGKQGSIWSKNAESIASGSKEAQNLVNSMKNYASEIQKIDVSKLGEDAPKVVSSAIEKLNQALNSADGNIDKIIAAWGEFEREIQGLDLSNLDTSFDNLRAELANLGISGSELDKLEAEFEQGAFSAEEFRQKLIALAQGAQTSVTHTVKLSESFGHLASTLMNVASLITAFKNLGSIWNNDDLTTGEKLIQTISSLGMIVMSFTSILSKNTLAHAANLAAAISGAFGWQMEATAASIASGATATLGAVLSSVVLPIALVTAGIAALVAIVTLLVKKLNEPTDAEKNLEKAM